MEYNFEYTYIFETERQSTRMSKVKNGWLGQYGDEPFEQQQFIRTAGIEAVNCQIRPNTTQPVGTPNLCTSQWWIKTSFTPLV